MLFSVLCGQVWFQNRRMKHKRQTLSKDETDIKTPKSKSESCGAGGLGDGGKVRKYIYCLQKSRYFLTPDIFRVAGAALARAAWAARAVSCLQGPRVPAQSRTRTRRSR